MRREPGAVADGALIPPPEVAAAIVAAAEMIASEQSLASIAVGTDDEGLRHGPEYVWRFSRRWWSLPVPLRRDRPWKDR
jgi:hypothetical protein